MSRMRSHSSSTVAPSSAAASSTFDVENQQSRPVGGTPTTGGNTGLTQELLSQWITNFSRQNSLSNDIIGLARRSNSNASNTPMATSVSNQSSAGQGSASVRSAVTAAAYNAVHDHDSDTPSHDPQESQEYLQRIRLCSLLDILSFCYRTALPIAAWVDYFSSGGMGYILLPILYCAVKLVDLMWKFQASFEGIKNYFTQTLVSCF